MNNGEEIQIGHQNTTLAGINSLIRSKERDLQELQRDIARLKMQQLKDEVAANSTELYDAEVLDGADGGSSEPSYSSINHCPDDDSVKPNPEEIHDAQLEAKMKSMFMNLMISMQTGGPSLYHTAVNHAATDVT